MGGRALILIDTHILVWMREDPARIRPKLLAAISAEPELRLSPISFWEIAMLVNKERITLSEPLLPWFRQILKMPKMGILPITPEVGVCSGSLPIHGDPGDRIIAATAIVNGCPLASVDGGMSGVPGLQLVKY